MMTLAPNVYWLIPARLIVGFASGLASVVVRNSSLSSGVIFEMTNLLY